MNGAEYDKYLNAIKGTNFSALKTLISNIEQVETNVVNNLNKEIEWEGDVREALRAKIDSVLPSFRSFKTNETANINNIIDLSTELMNKILEYKKLFSEITSLNNDLNRAKANAETIEVEFSGRGGKIDDSSATSSERFTTKRQKSNAEINRIQSQINSKTKMIGDTKIEIESLITKLKSVEFGTLFVNSTVASTASSSSETVIADVSLDGYKLDATLLTSIPASEYDNYFRNSLEKPIQNNINYLSMTLHNLNDQRSLASIVLTNMPGTTDPNQLVAIDMARLAHSRLTQQIEDTEKSLEQHQKLLDDYKAANKSKFWAWESHGEIKNLALERDAATSPEEKAEYNRKISEAVERFNSGIDSSNLIPIGDVALPFMASSLEGQNILGPEVGYSEASKETEVLSLFTESLYNSPRSDTEMIPTYNDKQEITGYTIIDQRLESIGQEYKLNKTDTGYDLVIGGKEPLHYDLPQLENSNN